MTVLYVTEQGATIGLAGGRVSVRKGDKRIAELPEMQLEQIVIVGHSHLTPALIAHCFARGIDVSYLSSLGRYRGRLQSTPSGEGELRLRQYARASNEAFKLATATAIVRGKIESMKATVESWRRLGEARRKIKLTLEQFREKAAGAHSSDQLCGYEGIATAHYYRAFRSALIENEEFRARQSHPPRDRVNALLSFGYTLLYQEVVAAIHLVGLDPYISFFHRPRRGHAALASDLMEEHRAPVIDAMVLKALNLRVFTSADWEARPDGAWRLQPPALKRFLGLYARRLRVAVRDPKTGDEVTHQRLIERQVRHFARVLRGSDRVYQPYVGDW